MERLLYQREWQQIPLEEIEVPVQGVADRAFYAAFYNRLLATEPKLSAIWIEQKHRIGQWLEAEFLGRRPSADLRVCSVGAGLGVAEAYLWRRGYRVDVLECERTSLRYLQTRCPGILGVVGDARALPLRGGFYDVVYMSAVDYCFDRGGYQLVLEGMRRLTRPGGRIVCVSVTNLSFRGLVRGTLRIPGWGGSAGLGRQDGVPWGYLRTVGEHLRVGRECGMVCNAVYLFDQRFVLRGVRTAQSVALGWPTLHDAIVAVAFTRGTG